MPFDPYSVSLFARTNFRNHHQVFGIKQSDRLFHFYCSGKTGSGKTTLLQTLMHEDISASRGFTFIDIHGDAGAYMNKLITRKYAHLPYIYFDVTNPDIAWHYNPLRSVSPAKRSLVASNILEIFHRNWKSAWGMKMEHILRMCLLTLLDQPRSNIADILKLLHDASFRNSCLVNVRSEAIRLFWHKEFPKYKSNDLLPIMNKVGALLSHEVVRKVLIDNKQSISFRKIMDSNTVLVINLAKGSVGTDVANILGGLLLTSLASACFSRIDTPKEKRVPHFLYIDEFQTISSTELVAELLAQIRKFNIGLIISNQFLHQLHPDVRASVLGNVGTIVCFRLGINDAKLMEKEFYPTFSAVDFTSLPNYSIYLRLMIDGKPSKPFSATTLL